jgi:hypothetical protein
MKLFAKNTKSLFPEAKHVIQHAFTVAGKEYYTFADMLNQPFERALTALIYYKEVDLNIDNEFLLKHTEAVNTVLTSNPIDVYKLKALNDLLKQRATLPKQNELLYKLASVVYFDKDENPAVYDFEYAKKKIAYWKEHTTLEAFFLQKPLVELIPYLKYAGSGLATYSQMIESFHTHHSDVVSGIISAN